eukprot:scaffold9955_cov24-Phaeocystis_antarctica.AAC.1
MVPRASPTPEVCDGSSKAKAGRVEPRQYFSKSRDAPRTRPWRSAHLPDPLHKYRYRDTQKV